MVSKLKIGTYYVANILKDKQNPKQLLMQGYFLGEEPQSSWQGFDAIPIGGLWNEYSEGPIGDIDPENLLCKILLIHNLETWKDENSKQRFAVNWNALRLDKTEFEEELNVLFDELVKETTPDYENFLEEENSDDDLDLGGEDEL